MSECHIRCALGEADHPGSQEYRCLDLFGNSLPFPGERAPGDIAVVDQCVAVYMPTRWEFMDGTWTAAPWEVGPTLGNVYDVAHLAATQTGRDQRGLSG